MAQPKSRTVQQTAKPLITYSQAVKNQKIADTQYPLLNSVDSNYQQAQTNNKLESMMIKLMEIMDIILNLLTTVVFKMS